MATWDLTQATLDQRYANAWKQIAREKDYIAPGSGANTWLAGFGTSAAPAVNGVSSGLCAFYIDPADYAAGTLTVKLRMRAELLIASVAPTAGTTFTPALWPVASWGGTGAIPTVASLGAAATSLTAFTSPAANSQSHVEGAAITFPTAGWYVMGMVTSAALPASCYAQMVCSLQVQQI